MSLSNPNAGFSTSNTTILCSAKKHFSAYIIPSLFIFLGLPFIFSRGSSLIGIIAVVVGILKILGLQSSSCILTNDTLYIKDGWLPWKKVELRFPIYNIY